MYYKALLRQSEQHLSGISDTDNVPVTTQLFACGGLWMQNKMNELDGTNRIPIKPIAFNYYGVLKYTACLLALFVSGVMLSFISMWLIPISIIVFYVAEVQLLFLFPLLIDGVKHPLTTSIKQTYKTGISRAIFNVIPIGFYMVGGLLDVKAPLKKWHIGCLSILIWYRDEVRNRL
nr:hypothetical protein [Mucilaginibacter sp. L294]